MSFFETPGLKLSGDSFSVVYNIEGSERKAYAKAKDICYEQTVEFPEEMLPPGAIKEQIAGSIISFEPHGENLYQTVISYAVELAAGELTQLINVVYGNISMKRGIRVEEVRLSRAILKNFAGPRFGRKGLRNLLKVDKRPLLFTALKPMGLSSSQLAALAYKFALGGIDLIKDDHGISNQPFSPFEERIRLCSEAVNRANAQTGNRCLYLPNVTASHSDVVKRTAMARDLGAGGILISPGLTGYETMREIAEDDGYGLPIFAHPSFLGSYVNSASGISHYTLFGQFARLAGADGTIYPNFGGRFPFTRAECKDIVRGTAVTMGEIKPIFPCPAGGMSLESIPDMLSVYGNDVIFLVGGGLFKHGPDLIESSRYFRKLVEDYHVEM